MPIQTKRSGYWISAVSGAELTQHHSNRMVLLAPRLLICSLPELDSHGKVIANWVISALIYGFVFFS